MSEQSEDFISTVSHELRTPLTSIRGFAQTMLASWDQLDDESKKHFLKIIEEQSNRLINLVENILSVNKLYNLIIKSVNVNNVIEMTAQIVQHQYKSSKIILNLNKKIPNILADNEKFQQIMTNLIENAAKYSDEGSEITVKSDFAPDDFIKIDVINVGEEIKNTDYDKIFEKFSRIDNPLTRKVQGSGLGLYIAKTLISLQHGQIFVNSKNHKTEFSILMPIDNIEKQAREKCLPQR